MIRKLWNRGCGSRITIQRFNPSQFPLGAGQLAGDARVVPARGVHGARKRLEQRLDNVMRLVAVEQFQMQVAPRLVG